MNQSQITGRQSQSEAQSISFLSGLIRYWWSPILEALRTLPATPTWVLQRLRESCNLNSRKLFLRVTQALQESRNLCTSHATSLSVTQALQESRYLCTSHAISPLHAASPRVTQPFHKSAKLSKRYATTPSHAPSILVSSEHCRADKENMSDLGGEGDGDRDRDGVRDIESVLVTYWHSWLVLKMARLESWHWG